MAQERSGVFAAKSGFHRRKQHHKRRHLNAARRGARAAADEHQERREELCTIRFLLNADGSKARRARVHRLKKRRVQLFKKVQITVCIVILKNKQHHRAENQKRQRCTQTDLRVKAQLFHVLPVQARRDFLAVNILKHHKARGADDDEHGNRQRDERVAVKGR